ncbi:hypothetical protein AVEN_92098-1 [Araneus ventricosus]|uniref:Uncharacterized protein n=1 Tax=Araneus ventricosus TaxID=182803 RepID=A0A4Y2HHP8_ARAVE|nr:hypothetical protein AVEN_92098-1 [Araneus ventricosus]
MPDTGPLTRSMGKKFEKLFVMMAEMKAGLEDNMEAEQQRLEQEMRSGQEEIKNQIQAQSQVDEIKIHVGGCIGKIDVQCVKGKIKKTESEVQRKIEGVEEKV